ncbi:efflux RND transporter periplasmic adaptor subunit [Corticibacter populi]
MRCKGLACLFGTLLLLTACSGERAESSAPPQAPPPEVGVMTLHTQPVTLSTELPGRTAAYLIAEVRPQVGGILRERLFEEGSDVKAGQVLYQIDPTSYRATLARAEASLESAKLLADRYDRLIQNRAISQQERDDARSQYLQAKATADTARIDVGYTRITAPISGRIGRSSVTQGALVTANQAEALATIQQLDPIYVDIVQPSGAMLQLREDLASGRLQAAGDGRAPVQLELENGRSYAHPGTLQFSEVSVDPGTGSVTLRAVFPNPDGVLLPGMFVRAKLQEGVREQGLLVPQRAVSRDNRGQPSVFVVNAQGQVSQRPIQTERTVGGDWLVSDGLQAGEQVIVDGIQRVRDGAQVKAVPVQAAPAPAAGAAPAAPAAPEANQ